MDQSQHIKAIYWTKRAADKLREIAQTIEARQDQAAAVAFIAEVNREVNLTAAFPYRNRPGRVSGTREIVMNTGYVIAYMIQSENLYILYLAHGRQQWPKDISL